MSKVDFKRVVADYRATIEEKIHEYNEALRDNDLQKANGAEDALKKAEKDYAAAKQNEVFDELSKLEDPVKEAITMHSYEVVSHREKKFEGVVTGLELVTDKLVQIDLLKLFEFLHKPTEWRFKVEKFNQLLALRTANELKLSKAQIKDIKDSFYMDELARQIDMGGTPDSNTAICKQLQMIVDAVIFEDNGKGKNVYRVNNHDVAYLLACYTKRGRKVLTVSVAKTAFVHRLVMDIMHRIVTGKSYSLDYKMTSKKNKIEVSEPKKAKAKPEAVEVSTVEKSA